MNPNEYFEKEYSVYHINDVVELKDLKSLHSLIMEYAKYYHQEQVKANSVLGDVSESFNEELRGKFFKECTHTRDDNGRTASIIRKIDVAPHDLFEWFKSNVI
jgi:hypothetical protein